MPIVSRLLLLVLVSQNPSGGGQSTASDSRCGSKCLFVALRAIGIGPESFSELERSLGPPGPEGYSFSELQAQARSCGAQTIAVQTTLANLLARREEFVCIALTNANKAATGTVP
jgi:hypothetical protein